MSKLSPKVVNKLGYYYRPVSTKRNEIEGLDERGVLIATSKPVTIPYRLPTIAQRVAEYERLGAIREAMYMDLDDDEFLDDLDDLPEEGLSPFEEPSSVYVTSPAEHRRVKAAIKARELAAAAPAGEAAEGPTATAAASPAPAKGGD